MNTVNAANLASFGVHSENVPYRTLGAELEFNGGLLNVKKTAINVDVLEVRGEGTVDFRKDKMNLELEFIPDLGSVPPALAVGVWNPLVAMALFGFSQFEEKASDSVLNRLVSQTYKLDGAPSDPKVHLVPVRIQKRLSMTNVKRGNVAEKKAS
ncbi:MAG: hypothetical protein H7249_04155 [Chitinophagaceae bacterium]|nr:hypothetical protein [Oligoflexus sp.]